MKVSTGLADHLATTGSIKGALDGGFIKLYHVAEPATIPEDADAAVTGTLLWTISLNGDGTGLVLEGRTGERGIFKPSDATWSGPTTAGPMPNYWRFVTPGDDGTASTTQKRIQGTAGTSVTAEMQLAERAFTTDASPTARGLSRFGAILPDGM